MLNPSNPSLDGPSHLYNAKLINYLLGGDKFISHYYSLTKLPVANLTDHYLLAFFITVFSWQVSEKILVVLYLLSFSFLFRKLIKQWGSMNIGLSIFAIPFSFSSFYYMGFYNFCLSFPLLFGILIYYHKYFVGEGKRTAFKNYSILCLLATLLYFTNGLNFLFAGLSLFLLEMNVPIRLWQGKLAAPIKMDFKRLLSFSLIWAPGVACFLVFIFKVHINSGNFRISIRNIVHLINVIKPLTVDSGRDEIWTRVILYLICTSLLVAIYFRVKRTTQFKTNPSDIFLLVAFISFLLFVIVPNNASVGMMSLRFLYFSFVCIVLWIALQPNNKIITWAISIALMVIHFTMLLNIHQPIISNLNKQVELVEEAGKVIKPNSIVLAKDYTNNWLLFHFADYMGVEKPLVILENYEADDGWFATAWNNYTVPKILINGEGPNSGYYNMYCNPSPETKAVDYIVVYGNYKDTIQRPDAKVMKSILSMDYKLIYTSTDNNIHIFSLAGIGIRR